MGGSTRLLSVKMEPRTVAIDDGLDDLVLIARASLLPAAAARASWRAVWGFVLCWGLGGDPRFSLLTLAYIPPGGLSTVRTIVLTLRAASP